MKYNMGTGDVIKPQYVVETLWNMTKDADTYITSDVSTRCGLRSITLMNHAAGSIQAAWAPWVFLTPPWASNSPNQVRGLLYYRRRLDTDVYPGAFDLPAIQHAGQDRLAEQHCCMVRRWQEVVPVVTAAATWMPCLISSSWRENWPCRHAD
jgi:hypothetical protein